MDMDFTGSDRSHNLPDRICRSEKYLQQIFTLSQYEQYDRSTGGRTYFKFSRDL